MEVRRNRKRQALPAGAEDAADGRGPKELSIMAIQHEEKPERIHSEVPGTSEVNFLFQPDTILPFHYFEMLGRHSYLEGEKKLMLAVLEDAIVVFQKYYFADDKEKSFFARPKNGS